MQGATVTLFWGTILTQYLWYNREPLYNHTRQAVKNAASFIWNASVRKLKELRVKKPLPPKEGEELLESLVNVVVETSNNLNEDKVEQNLINKEKKIRKQKSKKPRNLRLLTKRYEDWFLSNRSLKSVPKGADKYLMQRNALPFEMKQKCNEFEENMMTYNVQKLYEQYCEENDEQFNNGTILGYNPLASDDQDYENEKRMLKSTALSMK